MKILLKDCDVGDKLILFGEEWMVETVAFARGRTTFNEVTVTATANAIEGSQKYFATLTLKDCEPWSYEVKFDPPMRAKVADI